MFRPVLKKPMVFLSYSTMQMAAKIVYYGPGLGGKTTNLQYIYDKTSSGSRGEMVSLDTDTDRTLFFDLLPIDIGTIGGFATRIQLYTVPGQVFYNATRKLVLKGLDGVVFVADSQLPMLDSNVESFRNLEENLRAVGVDLDEIPGVMQFNKQDLPGVASAAEMNKLLNSRGWPVFEASALTGQGVFDTLSGISKLTLASLRDRMNGGSKQKSSVSVGATSTKEQAVAPPASPLPQPTAQTTEPAAAAPLPQPPIAQPAEPATTAPPPQSPIPQATEPATAPSPGNADAAAQLGSEPGVLAEEPRQVERVDPQPTAASQGANDGTDESSEGLARLAERILSERAENAGSEASGGAGSERAGNDRPDIGDLSDLRLSNEETEMREGSNLLAALDPAPAPLNGDSATTLEVNRELEIEIPQASLGKARHLSMSIRLEDSDANVVGSLERRFDLAEHSSDLAQLLLSLSVTVNSRD